MTLRRYYSSFKSLTGILAGLVAAFPYISKLLPSDASAYAFPPLGDGEAIARIAAVLFAVAVTFGVFFWASRLSVNIARVIAISFAISALSFCLYFGLHIGFVRRLDVPSQKTTVYVSVGYERTEFAKANFKSATDEDLIRGRGMDDEQIRLLWTTKSLIIARLSLYVSYCVCILGLVLAFSTGVAHDVLSREGSAVKTD
jgi:hypothetical protein